MDRLKYNRENYRAFSIRLNKVSEEEVIRFLESRTQGLKGYLLHLVKVDMERQRRYKKWPAED